MTYNVATSSAPQKVLHLTAWIFWFLVLLAIKAARKLRLIPNCYKTHVSLIERLIQSNPRPSVKGLTVETASICNAKCSFCPYPKVAFPKKIMPEDSFLAALELSRQLRPIDIDFTPYLGEALVDQKIFERIARMRASNPEANIQVTTNGTLISKAVAENLIASGLDEIHVSFGSWGSDEYKLLYGIDSWEKVLSGVTNLLEAKRASGCNLKISLWFRTINCSLLKSNPSFQKFLDDFSDVVNDHHIVDTYHDMPWISGMQPEWLKRDKPIYLKSLKRHPCRNLSRVVAAANGGYFCCGCAASDIYRGHNSWFFLGNEPNVAALTAQVTAKVDAWIASAPPIPCQGCPVYTPASEVSLL